MPAKLVETAWLQNKGITSQLFTAVFFFFANYVATRQTERLPKRKNEMPKQIKITYIIEILCTIKAVCLPYMISKFSKAFAGYVVSKGGLISEGIFNLVPTSKECVKSLSKGQLISKCLFGIFKFFQKTNENKSHSSKVEFVCSFFGRNVSLKKSFRLCLTFTNISIQVEKSLGTKLKIPSEIKLPLSKRGHFFNAQKNLRRSADPHKSPKT